MRSARGIARDAAEAQRCAIRRRALKRWLRARNIAYSPRIMYSEAGLRKLVRANCNG